MIPYVRHDRSQRIRRRFLFLLLFVPFHIAAAATPLPAQGADVRELTVSGLSSGAYMAVQMHVAHSSKVKGVGAVAGGPYYCAQDSYTAIHNCMAPSPVTPLPDNATLKAAAEHFARDGLIDPLEGVAGARVWLFTGTKDRIVRREVVEALKEFYASLNVDPVLVSNIPAGHAMVTTASGNACGTTKEPYVNRCNYDAAHELLSHVLGPLSPASTKAAGQLLSFDQKPFADDDPWAISMAETGYVYVPSACKTSPCRVHIAFHGCEQNFDKVKKSFVLKAGYNRWADTNRLIVLYPQTRIGALYNPNACWDWWSYTDEHYATKEGPQIQAVMRMVERLGEARPSGQKAASAKTASK